ncbi:MAG TPA: aminoglycoside 6-adenylyltransferase, partial [Thermomicrobiales bacterium]|nr:aminoglycoside 6-adenylyltransferase [Thermomicrobiales bacterium]
MPDIVVFPHDSMVDRIISWVNARDDVRAAILTSTRAVPGATVDALSDYDLILTVRDIQPYAADHRWIEDFGSVLVAYWDPVGPGGIMGVDQVSNVVQYDGTLKIDFTVWPVEALGALAERSDLPAELDAGYRVLVDKDGL